MQLLKSRAVRCARRTCVLQKGREHSGQPLRIDSARDVYLPKHVITTDQLADPFTKALNRVAFNSLRIRLMGVTDGEKTRRRSGGADSVH